MSVEMKKVVDTAMDNLLPMSAIPDGWYLGALKGTESKEFEYACELSRSMKNFNGVGPITCIGLGHTPRAAMLDSLKRLAEVI